MISVEGTIEEIIYKNDINGYTVCTIVCEKEEVTLVGFLPFINAGETIKATGKWTNHPDYGDQLKVEFYEKLMPKTTEAIEKYLSSGIVKGIGPATAAKIVDKFGEETLEIIQFNPAKLSDIRGISMEKALTIGHAFEEQKELMSVVMFCQKYGISSPHAVKIYKTFGVNSISEIKENPYKLTDERFNIGFKTADEIAKNMGVDPLSRFRLSSGIKYGLSKAATNGHTYITEENLKEYICQLLEVDAIDIDDALISLSLDNSIHLEKLKDTNRIYLNSLYQAEINVCRKLAELSSICFDGDIKDFDKKIIKLQAEEGLILAENQKKAIKEALVNGVMVITGGPGTGKTTIIKSIIKLLTNEGHDVSLAAPTGRAAKRMSEATGFEAKTIHRLLEIGFLGMEEEQIFARNDSNPIEADVIIIDEMSMVDIQLMNSLLEAVASGTRLVLVGDIDQLPSVGPGNVLKDIISSGVVKTVRLTEIFRQAEESMIVVNAHRINRGERIYLNKKDKDFFFIKTNNPNSIVQTIVDLCNKRLPVKYGYDPLKHIQVLTPTKKGVVGVGNLNTELQKILNPQRKNVKEKTFNGFIFREGDRVMQVKNNYNIKWEKKDLKNVEGIGVFNGDTGIIQNIDSDAQNITVLFDEEKTVEYDFSILDEIELAYAVTIHKSQGSEFPVIIMPLYPGPQILLTRNLLYTGITRAKDLVVLVGQEGTLDQMINNQRETLRNSNLSDKIRKCIIGLN